MEREIAATGEVTVLEDCFPKGIIDGRYFFKKALITDPRIRKGSKVDFVARFSPETQEWEVTAIKLFLSQKDIERIERRKFVTFIGKVMNIDERKAVVQYGKSFQEDIQAIPAASLPEEYIVQRGDYLKIKLELKNPENEYSMGNIHTVEPTNRKTLVGKVTVYQGKMCIDNTIYYDLSVCLGGRSPSQNNYVRVEAVESQQTPFCWRAISVRPSNFQIYAAPDKEEDAWLSHESSWSDSLKELTSDKFGIKITPAKSVGFGGVKVGCSTTRSLEIQNNSSLPVTLKDVSIKGDQSVCKFVVDKSHCEGEECLLVIEPQKTQSLNVTCYPQLLGTTRELMVLQFEHCRIGRHITVNALSTEKEILAELNTKDAASMRNWKSSRSDETITRMVQEKSCPVVRGIQPIRAPFFMQKRLENNFVPKYLWEIIEAQDEAGLVKKHPGLIEDLKIQNYLDKFRAALWLEEIENEVLRREFDVENITLRGNRDGFTFDAPGIKDINPPVLLGDRISVLDYSEATRTRYEGFVYEIHGDTIFVKISEQFKHLYKGTPVTIQFSMSRTTYKRCHHAIEQAVRHLGEDWLFPENSIQCKPPRIPFIEVDDALSNDSLSSSINKLVLKKEETEVPNGTPTPTGTLNLFRRRQPAANSSNPRNSYPSPFRERPLDRRTTSMRGHFESDTLGPSGDTIKLKWFNAILNAEQKDAVRRILRGQSRPLPYIIYGPPGTGKTVTIVEAIIQVNKLDKNSRILVVGPSNSAADVIAMNLVASNQFETGDFVRLVGFMRQEFQVPESIRDYCVDGDCIDTVARHRLIVCTSTTAGQFFQLGLHTGHFTHVFIDEAGYCTEPEALIASCLVALDKSGQVILAGDPKQLGPVLMSDVATQCGLSLSLLERLMSLPVYSRNEEKFPVEKYNPLVLTKLVKNYRAHPDLLKIPSKLFYDDELEAAAAEETINLCHSINFLKDKGTPLLFHGIQGNCFRENDSPSWYNPAEIIQVVDYVRMFRSNGVPNDNIGIITPYRKQVEKLRKALELGLLTDEIPRIGSVEEFQGGEREVMIMSLVRSFDVEDVNRVANRLSFVFSPKRFNVAVTRAKAVLVVLGNPHILVVDEVWRTFMKYCIELGCYKGCDLPCELFSEANETLFNGSSPKEAKSELSLFSKPHIPNSSKANYDSDGEQECISDTEFED